MASLKRPFSSTQDRHDMPSKVQMIDLTDDAPPILRFQSAMPTVAGALPQFGLGTALPPRPIYIDNRGSAYHPQMQVPQPASSQNLYCNPRISERLGHAPNESEFLAASHSPYNVAHQNKPALHDSQASPYCQPVPPLRYLPQSTHRQPPLRSATSDKPTTGRLLRCGAQDQLFEESELRRTIANLPGMDPRLERAWDLIDDFDGNELRFMLRRTANRYKHQVGEILKFEQHRQRDRINMSSPFWDHCKEVERLLWQDYDRWEPSAELSREASDRWSAIGSELTKFTKRLRPDLHLLVKRDAWAALMTIGGEVCGSQDTAIGKEIGQHFQKDTRLSRAIYRCFTCFSIDDLNDLRNTDEPGISSWLDGLEELRDGFAFLDFNCDLLDAVRVKVREDLAFCDKSLMHIQRFDPDSDDDSYSGTDC